MSRLVVIRVGDPVAEWLSCGTLGKWSSPECHKQEVRDMFVQGYTVYGLFVSNGDYPLMVAKITNVLQRTDDEMDLPPGNDIGDFKTILMFDYQSRIDLRASTSESYRAALDYAKYQIGSQILIPSYAYGNFWSFILENTPNGYSYFSNSTVMNQDYWINLNLNRC